jgi:hypothetical protein
MGGNSTLTFKSGVAPLSGPMPMLANGAIVIDYIQVPITCYNAGENFIINQDNAVTVGGMIWYIQI